MMTTKDNFWMVRAGEGGYLIDEFLTENIVAIGWNELDDLSVENSLEEIKEKLKQAEPSAISGKINNHAGQIF